MHAEDQNPEGNRPLPETPLYTFKENGFTVEVFHDPDVSDPHDEVSPGCALVMTHRRYNWPNDAGIVFDHYSGWDEVAQELRDHHGAVVTDTIYAYEHSGIMFKTGERTYPFDDRWDSGIAGLAYMTRSRWLDITGEEWAGSDEEIARARELIAGEVSTYGMWCNGETYGYIITDEYGKMVDSLWYFLGYDCVIDDAKHAAARLGRKIKCNGTLDRGSGEIEHSGPCPLHG